MDSSNRFGWYARLVALVPGLTRRINVMMPCEPCAYLSRYRTAETEVSITVRAAVMHLNDVHRWPRERIAAWLELLDGVDLEVVRT